MRQLEKATGISKSALNNIENEKSSPTLNELDKIANALNCKISDLYKTG